MTTRNKKSSSISPDQENIPPTGLPTTSRAPPQKNATQKQKRVTKKATPKSLQPTPKHAAQGKTKRQGYVPSSTDSDSDDEFVGPPKQTVLLDANSQEDGQESSDSDKNFEEGQVDRLAKILHDIKKNQQDTNNKVSVLANHIDNPEFSKHQWKKDGLKKQHDVAQSILYKQNMAISALETKKTKTAITYLKQGNLLLLERMKDQRMADSSEAGWETVNVYKTHPVADDAEDDRHIRKAEKIAKECLAAKAKKARGSNNHGQNFRRDYHQDSRKDYPRSDRYHYYRSSGSSHSQDQNQRSTYVPDNRRGPQRKASSNDLCFYCGLSGHWQDSCPTKHGKRQ